ncbi:arylsulfatase [Lentisphaera araneosa HTCC2155]|uniref:Arylsulfatase n=2 Tax=Lentisphaera TaxID=256846 RepID=A6DIC6_9BACT|nr:arylsulfatase [Lentisphaera araneosa HTCC2155]
MTDDQGYGDYSFMGNPILETPHLDKLANESVLFKRFYVNAVCTPTRASLFTGRSSYRTGVTDTWIGRSIMKSEEYTLAEAFKDNQYSTGLFGKWHLGDCYPYRAMDQGFDYSLIHRGGGLGQPADHPENNRAYTNSMLYRNEVAFRSEGFCTDVFFREARKWISEKVENNKPFFACIMPNAPHSPFHDVPADLLKKYKNADWSQHKGSDKDKVAAIYAMVENIDQNIADLRDELKKLNIDKKTIILFSSDNGGWGERFDAGLRGSKSSSFEGGVLSPLMLFVPGQASKQSTEAIAHYDVLPTLVDLCDLKVDFPNELDGRSFLPILSGESLPERSIILQSHRGTKPEYMRNSALIQGEWKLVSPDAKTLPKLFNLSSDAGELQDVSSKYPEKLKSLVADYDQWFKIVKQQANKPCAIIATKHEVFTTLTRQDWVNMQGQGGWLSDKVNGEWLVEVKEDKEFEISFRTKAIFKQASLLINDKKIQTIDFRNQAQHYFKGIHLKPGLKTIKITYSHSSAGPWQVDIHSLE